MLTEEQVSFSYDALKEFFVDSEEFDLGIDNLAELFEHIAMCLPRMSQAQLVMRQLRDEARSRAREGIPMGEPYNPNPNLRKAWHEMMQRAADLAMKRRRQ